MRRSLPQTRGKIALPGLEGRVQILRDRWGVPHIYAGSNRDLSMALGYVHAQDRLWQMDLNTLLQHFRSPFLVRRAENARMRSHRVRASSRENPQRTSRKLYYLNINAAWRSGGYIPMLWKRPDIEQHSIARLYLEPQHDE